MRLRSRWWWPMVVVMMCWIRTGRRRTRWWWPLWGMLCRVTRRIAAVPIPLVPRLLIVAAMVLPPSCVFFFFRSLHFSPFFVNFNFNFGTNRRCVLSQSLTSLVSGLFIANVMPVFIFRLLG